MKKFTIFMLILFSFLLSQFSFAFDNYPFPNYNTGVSEGGLFNTELEDTDVYSRGLTDGFQMPYVYDIDNDGVDEILVVDNGNNIVIYTGKTLSIEGAISIPDISGIILSNLELVDIDNDGDIEISFTSLASSGSSNLNFTSIYWNGSESVVETKVETNNASTLVSARAMLKCAENSINDVTCFSVFMSNGGERLNYHIFDNSSTVQDSAEDYTPNWKRCLPKIPYIAFEDYDADGINEFVFATLSLLSVSTDRVELYAFRDTGFLVRDRANKEQQTINWAQSPSSCFDSVSLFMDNPDSLITNVLVFDTSKAGDGKETIVGSVYDGRDGQSSMIMYAFDKNWNLVDDYPETGLPYGSVLSNLIAADVMYDTDYLDVCMMGLDYHYDTMTILCGNKDSGVFWESHEATIDIPYNHSDYDLDNFAFMIHSGDFYTDGNEDLADGSAVDEIVTPFGIYHFADRNNRYFDTVTNIFDFNADPYFITEAAIIPIDYDGAQQSDMLMVTEDLLIYIDDKLGNTHCDSVSQDCTDYFSTNPSINAIMKENCTFRTQIRVHDEEDDLMQYRITLYKDHSNEQTTGWVNATSDRTQLYTNTNLLINQTITSGVLSVETRDLDDDTQIQIDEYNFVVDSSGDCFGDSEFIDDTPFTDPSVVDYEPTDTTLANNTVTNAINQVTAWTGLGTGILWFILMIILGVGIMTSIPHKANSSEFLITVGVIGFLEFLMLFVGYKLEFYGFGTIATIIVIALAIISLVIRNKITGTGGG